MAKPKFELKTFPGTLAGEALFHIDKHDEGKVLDTGWLSCGLGQGTYLLKTAVSVDDGPWFMEVPVVFEDAPAILAKAKFSAALDAKTGRLRFGVKLKKAGQAELHILWQASPAEAEPGPDKKTSAPATADTASNTTISSPDEDDAFYIENAPVTLHAGWKYTLRAHIPARFLNAGPTIRWETTAEDAGQIDAFGCYTAPEKPGAYEVRAFLEGADEEASVYMIVL